ncbi:MAG: SIS domain-containing protein [Treponema sp.]|jgi:D-sedoheptulose 7-phosphate isomerase|nr:SIS domain-containing protein [Treponema sp.]
MDYLQELITRYPALKTVKDSIKDTFEIITASYATGGKLLIAGNGGSAADSEHIVGELMKSFVKKRGLPQNFIDALKSCPDETAFYLSTHLQPGLPAISLAGHPGLSSACVNDIDGQIGFAQQVYCLGRPGDVFWGISTSGNSKNIFYALITAKAAGLKTIALTGGSGGILAKAADTAIIVPEKETYKIQELHLPVYHSLCLMLEEYFF